MYIAYIVKRTQIYIDREQDKLLATRAGLAGTTKSFEIREAIAQYLAGEPSDSARLAKFKAVVHDVAGTAPELPAGAEYVVESRRAGRDREATLDAHRRRR